MKQVKYNLSRTSVGAIIGLMWTLATILLMFGIGNASDQVLEKMFSGEMMVIGYFLAKREAEISNYNANQRADCPPCDQI